MCLLCQQVGQWQVCVCNSFRLIETQGCIVKFFHLCDFDSLPGSAEWSSLSQGFTLNCPRTQNCCSLGARGETPAPGHSSVLGAIPKPPSPDTNPCPGQGGLQGGLGGAVLHSEFIPAAPNSRSLCAGVNQLWEEQLSRAQSSLWGSSIPALVCHNL